MWNEVNVLQKLMLDGTNCSNVNKWCWLVHSSCNYGTQWWYFLFFPRCSTLKTCFSKELVSQLTLLLRQPGLFQGNELFADQLQSTDKVLMKRSCHHGLFMTNTSRNTPTMASSSTHSETTNCMDFNSLIEEYQPGITFVPKSPPLLKKAGKTVVYI